MTSTDDELLTPAEVARMLGVAGVTVARWAREGRLDAVLTLGGHRRYRTSAVGALLKERSDPGRAQMIADAVRLYEQDWSIRQVAAKFGCTFGVMRRILREHTTLRPSSRGASRSQDPAP